MQLKRGRCRVEALASTLDAQSRRDVSVLGLLDPLRLEVLELVRQLRRPTSRPALPASNHQDQRISHQGPLDEDLCAGASAGSTHSGSRHRLPGFRSLL